MTQDRLDGCAAVGEDLLDKFRRIESLEQVGAKAFSRKSRHEIFK